MTATSTEAAVRLGAAELQRLLTAADPAALLVQPRVVRRIIKQARAIRGLGLQVPHRKTYVVGREALLALADRQELAIPDERELPPQLILIGCPEPWLLTHTREQALVRFWRMLFHARIDQEIGQRLADGRLDEPAIRALVEQVGAVEFEEACGVLTHEHFLLPPADLGVCFTEFVALFLELHYFARPLLPRYFPAIEDLERVEHLLADFVGADALYAATRLAGAPEPVIQRAHEEEMVEEREAGPGLSSWPSPTGCHRLMARADQLAARGNVVRAALLRTRAAQVAPAEMLEAASRGARADIDRLVNRLQAALELRDREAEEWRATLPALLTPAIRGLFPQSARLLTDLQKVCVDYERDLYAVDLVEWVVSLGRKPIKRAVPLQADVLLVKHLRSAQKRLGKVRIGEEDRRRLGILLRSALHHCEERLRERVRPILTRALDEVGFTPASYPEHVARRKLIEEVLDRVAERGFLTMGDLRDAISRNQLKLPDVGNPITLLTGDQLLRLNRKLAVTLDGVYHRGEIYLRWLQRFGSLFFGTAVGRWLTLYLIIPFGGAYATLVFVQEMLHLVRPEPAASAVAVLSDQAATIGEAREAAETVKLAVTAGVVAVLGVFYLLLIHVRPFRRKVADGLMSAWHGTRWVFTEMPEAVLNSPAVRRVLDSRPVVQFRRYALKPLLAGGLAALAAWLFGASAAVTWGVGGGVLVLAGLLFNSRLGRRAEDVVADWMARNWYWLRVDVLPGLARLTLQVFKDFLDGLERIIYTVDEWLRFRSGDSKWGLFFKPILGLFWFVLTYVVRVIINLFVEPTVNPIKHFPAVTVGAKIILPLLPAWAITLTGWMSPVLGVALAGTVAGTIIILFPGIFGFMVWEFKENWKLYRANRSRLLKPVMIGHHGETMLRLLKPGFHSGTLPKLYAKLRKAERRVNGRALHKHQETLHHVKESLCHFVERELLLLLEDSKAWGGVKLHVGVLVAASNRVRVELCAPDLGEEGVWLAFEERSGWLTAEVAQPGWLGRLSESQRAAFAAALAGLYKKAGVVVVGEQLEASLPGPYAWQLTADALLVWPGPDFARPPERHVLVRQTGAPVPGERLLFGPVEVTWQDWVEAWQADQAGRPPHLPLPPEVRLLPAPSAAPAVASAAGVSYN